MFVLLLIGAWWPASPAAANEQFTGAGLVQLKPVDPPKVPGGGATTQSTPATGRFRCSLPLVSVQASPSGFVVGNCPQNTEMRRIRKSSVVDVGQGVNDTYEGGYIFGAFSGCGWIRSAQSELVDNTAFNNCDPNSIGYTQDEFTYRNADGSYFFDGCGGTAACSGTPIANRQTCYAVANIRPWLSGQARPPALRYIGPNEQVNGQPRLAWRYLAKYPTTEGNYWFMVRDRAVASGQGNWVFVPYACL